MEPASPAASCPFRWLFARAPGPLGAKAELLNIRRGRMQFDAEGVIVQSETGRTTGFVTGMRWSQMREIVLAPAEQQACFVYDAPNFAGKMVTLSLAFMPAPGYYEMVAQAVHQYASIPIQEGRLKNATKPIVWIILFLLLLILVGINILNHKEGYDPTLR